MSQEIETEFKNIISSKEYYRLVEHFQLNVDDAIVQHNYYFDTQDFNLRDQHIGLRLRITDKYNHLTLKYPNGRHQMLETTDKLSDNEAKTVIETGTFPAAEAVSAELKKYDVTLNEVKRFASFETHRLEATIPDSTVVLDECHFDHFTDHELEIETTRELGEGERQFKAFLHEHQIPIRPSKKKMIRMQRQSPVYSLD